MAAKKSKFKIVIGSDHAGFQAKTALAKLLSHQGHGVLDRGAFSEDPTDYPDYALRVAKTVKAGKVDRGILVCGSGLGMAIMANKVRKIRAVPAWSVTTAKLAAQHNWANILCLSGRFTPLPQLKKMVLTWLNTPYEKGGRHQRRVKKILKYEAKL